jgi:hypothetical protein
MYRPPEAANTGPDPDPRKSDDLKYSISGGKLWLPLFFSLAGEKPIRGCNDLQLMEFNKLPIIK